ncbi:MAG: peptidoglycan DD-metalloendopeptidase family protein [Bacilli bacterium]|nr:peptidoglycan DD-metalloendopeptidase family protein [Bacilli bacterium]
MRKRLISILTIVLVSVLILPIDTKAITLREYEDKVNQYTKELNDKNNDIAISKKKLEEIQKKITEYEGQIQAAQQETERLEAEIQKNNEEIKAKNAESKKIIEYYQVSNGENAYLEYAFGATSITDMIYRMSIVEQLTEYNDRVMKELQALIDANKQKQAELAKKQEELRELNKKLAEEAAKVKGNISSMEGMVPNIKGQLSYYQQRVKYYKSIGCESDDQIGIDCDRPVPARGGGSIAGANGFVFPVDASYRITTGYYWDQGGHKGIDIGKYCGAPIKAVAAGRVYYVGNGKDLYGAKMVMIVHNVGGRLVYSQYAHLNGYAVREGQDVYAGQTVGYMGNSGYSFGCHLHLEMSEDLGWDYPDPGNYYRYIRKIVNPYKYIPG